MARFARAIMLGTAAAAFASFSTAQEKAPEIVPFSGGQYMIYGGDLGDVTQPKAGDAKLYLDLSGEMARQMFDRLGRASENRRCVQPPEIMRRKGDVVCVRSPDKTYSCQVGFNLTTGKSINSSIC